MKYGYQCSCGWRLNRGGVTRRVYAAAKQDHAKTCEALRKELEQSRTAKAA